jgi:hypothetical protein
VRTRAMCVCIVGRRSDTAELAADLEVIAKIRDVLGRGNVMLMNSLGFSSLSMMPSYDGTFSEGRAINAVGLLGAGGMVNIMWTSNNMECCANQAAADRCVSLSSHTSVRRGMRVEVSAARYGAVVAGTSSKGCIWASIPWRRCLQPIIASVTTQRLFHGLRTSEQRYPAFFEGASLSACPPVCLCAYSGVLTVMDALTYFLLAAGLCSRRCRASATTSSHTQCAWWVGWAKPTPLSCTPTAPPTASCTRWCSPGTAR